MTRRNTFSIASLGVVLLAARVHAADHSAILPYVADDVVAVGYFQLDKVDLAAMTNELKEWGTPDEALQDLAEHFTPSDDLRTELIAAGCDRVYFLFRVTESIKGGVTLVLPVGEKGDAKAVHVAMADFGGRLWALLDLGWGISSAKGDVVFVLPAKEGAPGEPLKPGVEPPRKEVADALAAIGDADAAFAIVGDADSRRVLREMLPSFPPPIPEIDGKLLADGVRWAGLAITFPPQPTITVMVDAADSNAATTLSQANDKIIALAKVEEAKVLITGEPTEKARAAALLPILSQLTPVIFRTRLSITFGDDPREMAAMKATFGPALASAREAAYNQQRMNDFKQLALGILNYESSKGALPPAAIRDQSGKALLSWRVAILPWIEQNSLYDQFHLDEPWDSEHNLKLVEKMPELYADPDPTIRHALGDAGRTTFVVPVGDKAVFRPNASEGSKYRDIKDGTSNTVMIVEVVPERAVVWTKPDDWDVDLKDSLRGVKRSDRTGFTAAYCDGSVRLVPNTIDPANWAKILTCDGGEVVDFSY